MTTPELYRGYRLTVVEQQGGFIVEITVGAAKPFPTMKFRGRSEAMDEARRIIDKGLLA
jgi:hypothetical protein